MGRPSEATAEARLLNGSFLATVKLVIEQEIDGLVDELEVGDAITRTITIRVRDLPAMFIPPVMLKAGDLSGLRAYPRDPMSEDLPGREAGRTTGRRVESMVYVIQEPGDHTLPEINLRWWNRRTGRVETARAPAVSFHVPVPPFAAAESDLASGSGRGEFGDRWIRFALAASILLVLVAVSAKVLRRRARGLLRGWEARRRRRAMSEPVRFRELQRIALRGTPGDLYRGLETWLGSNRRDAYDAVVAV